MLDLTYTLVILNVHFTKFLFCDNSTIMPNVLFSAGSNSCSQLGRLSESKDPAQIFDFDTSGMVSISCGNGFTVSVFENGDVFGWGYNESGCIGFEDQKEKNLPRKVENPKLIDDKNRIVMASCGDNETVFLKENGDVFLTDADEGFIKLDISDFEPVSFVECVNADNIWLVGKSGNVFNYNKKTKYSNIKAKKVAAGNGYAVVINENDCDQLYGIGKIIDNDSEFCKIDSLDGHSIKKVVAHNEHCIVLTQEKKVFVWGKGAFGNLGLGNSIRDTDNKFIENHFFDNISVVDIGVGNAYSCFIDSSGNFYSCGLAKDGRTMMGDTTDRKTPMQSTKIKNASRVFCGSSHTIVLCESEEKDNFENMEKLIEEIQRLKKENNILKDENFRLKSAKSSLEAENAQLQKIIDKININTKGVKSNPMKCYDDDELKKLTEIERIDPGYNKNCEVFKVESTNIYSINYVNISNYEFTQFLCFNSQILTTLHPCLNRVVGYSNGVKPCIIYEFHEKTLNSLVEHDYLTNTEKALIIIEIMLGIRFLHSFNVAHNNIYPSHIQIDNKHAKLSDINIFASIEENRIDFGNPFISPEIQEMKVVSDSSYDKRKADIFSLGTLLYYILSDGKFPIHCSITDELFNDDARQIIESCWIEDPSKRPCINEIFERVRQCKYQLIKDVDVDKIHHHVTEIESFERKNEQHVVFNIKPPTQPPNSSGIIQSSLSPRMHSSRKPQLMKPLQMPLKYPSI